MPIQIRWARLRKIAPERIVWGSDWPHPTIDRGLNQMTRCSSIFGRMGAERSCRRRILVTNPEALYGFPPTPE
jgi:predicted TIM-barrel fold metal-dependent hydrolase